MKQITLSIVLLILLATACETEQVIVFRDRIDTVLLPSDTIRLSALERVINVKSIPTKQAQVRRDTVIQMVTDTIIDQDTVIIERPDTVIIVDTVYVEIIVEVRDTVYVPRETELIYPEKYEPIVTRFFELIDGNRGRSGMLAVDVTIHEIEEGGFYSYSAIGEGRWNIYIRSFGDCPEASIYREMMHTLFGVDYLGEWYPPGDDPAIDHIMTINWPFCLESHPRRQELLNELF